MHYSNAILNTIFYLDLLVTDTNGDSKSGLTVTYTLYKSSDDSIIDTGILSDVGNGVYKGTYNFTISGQYYIIYETPSGYTNEIEGIYADKEYAKQEELLRSLGLNDENKKVLNPVYDTNGNLTYSLVKLYPTSLDFVNDTNVMATYEMTATYDGNSRMQTFGVKKL